MTVTLHVALPSAFHTVVVTVSNAPGGGHQVSFDPPAIEVDTRDAVINYQLVAPTPDTLRFIGMAAPAGQRQFSAASVAIDGKLLTFIDANTDAAPQATLTLVDDDGTPFTCAPVIVNRPA